MSQWGLISGYYGIYLISSGTIMHDTTDTFLEFPLPELMTVVLTQYGVTMPPCVEGQTHT